MRNHQPGQKSCIERPHNQTRQDAVSADHDQTDVEVHCDIDLLSETCTTVPQSVAQ